MTYQPRKHEWSGEPAKRVPLKAKIQDMLGVWAFGLTVGGILGLLSATFVFATVIDWPAFCAAGGPLFK